MRTANPERKKAVETGETEVAMMAPFYRQSCESMLLDKAEPLKVQFDLHGVETLGRGSMKVTGRKVLMPKKLTYVVTTYADKVI